MNNKEYLEFILFTQANMWLEKNPERLTTQEVQKFKADLMHYIHGESKDISDEVFDFLKSLKITKEEDRHTEFYKYLKNKYGDLEYFTVLDVGAGRMCHLSEKLAKLGCSVVAMDPNIRITDSEAKAKKIMALRKELFTCDMFAKHQNGTDVTTYDLLVGLEPCMATEHIIRQGLSNDKPFDVALCYANHNALNGKKFKTPEEWYYYLKSISSEIKDVTNNGTTILTNCKPLPSSQQSEKTITCEADDFSM